LSALLKPQKQKIEFPEKLQFLFEPNRYKILYGGRGGAKSWGIARALLTIGAQRPLRVLCAREIQKSIADSVHKLLKDQIEAMGLSAFYEVQNAVIRGKNGTEFTFHGLKHNVSNIKSVEGTDICWVEEAQNVSKSSWETLIPTIRKPGSEIWVSFNPGLEQDETYQRFIVRPPTGAIVAKVNYTDNPWFPAVLRQEMEDLRARSEDDYRHVWEGACKTVLDGAIYADELRRATAENRITRVPYDPIKPVSTYWDLGYSDSVSIWCAQVVGMEWRIVDFIQSNRKPASWYVSELQKRPYAWGLDWLPHDGKATTMAAAALPEPDRTIAGQLRSLGRKVRVLPQSKLVDGINAVRTVFDRCWFDAEKCADGLHALRHYRYEVDEDTGAVSRLPMHDWSSHAADAFRTLAMSIEHERREASDDDEDRYRGPGAWLG
jgi:phage terminase large subunit